MSSTRILDVGAIRRSAKRHAKSLGHEEGYGFHDAVAHAEDLIAEHPDWDQRPYTDISDKAYEVCYPSFEDAP